MNFASDCSSFLDCLQFLNFQECRLLPSKCIKIYSILEFLKFKNIKNDQNAFSWSYSIPGMDASGLISLRIELMFKFLGRREMRRGWIALYHCPLFNEERREVMGKLQQAWTPGNTIEAILLCSTNCNAVSGFPWPL